jgi:hypothetical protein
MFELNIQHIKEIKFRRRSDYYASLFSHRRMTHFSPSDLNYEIAGLKKCLSDHGINATVIATTTSWHKLLLSSATVVSPLHLVAQPCK